MAKAKEPAAEKSSSGTSTGKTADTTAVGDSSAASSASKAGAAAASAKTEAAKAEGVKTSSAVSPSEMKKELEAKAKPTPAVAKEVPGTFKAAREEKPAAETPSPVAPAPKPSEPAERSSIFWPVVIGGVIAGVLGFLASEMALFGDHSQVDDLRATLSLQSERLSTLEAVEPQMPDVAFPALDDLTAGVSDLTAGVSDLTAGVTELTGRLDDLDARLTGVEKQPISGGTSQAAIAAYERELQALQSSVAAQRAEIEGLLNNALSVEEATAQVATTAKVQGALTEIMGAINSGQPFSPALVALADNGVADVPSALSGVAENGVQTLNALQTRFPDAARAALRAARASGTNDAESGFGGFLRRQLGARSVTPREGDGPDAVLSRAEAAVREGRLNDALGELDALPVPAQDAMKSWLEDARARQAAEVATQDLSQNLSAN